MRAQATTRGAASARTAAVGPENNKPTGKGPAGIVDAGPPQGNGGARTFRQAMQHWLDWQCRMIAGVHHGSVYLPAEDDSGSLQPLALWPLDTGPSSVAAGFAAQAWTNGRTVLQMAADDRAVDAEVRDFVAFPVVLNGRTLGVVALALEMRAEAQRQAVVQLLAWGAVWLENTLLGAQGERRSDAPLALRAIATLSSDLPLGVSTHQLCDLIAGAFGCSQVAIGMQRGMLIEVIALSDQLQFDRRQDALLRLQAAMEECVDQAQQICVPREIAVGQSLHRAHERLLELPSTAAVCSLPFGEEPNIHGAMTLVWAKADAVDAGVTARIADLGGQLGPVFSLKHREQRPLWHRIRELPLRLAARLFGGAGLRFKLGMLVLAVVLGSLFIIQTDRRVTAEAAVEGRTQLAIVAPVDGYLLSASARAGDLVEQGQVLAIIDDRELQLELQKWRSESDKHAKEYQEALGGGDRAKASIASARMAQANAERDLILDQVERTRLRAPFSGTLVSGDLSRSLGAPLQRGQLLFEIVPDENYRVSLQVDEHDIAALGTGQSGDLRLAGMPDSPIGFTIERIVPLATADQAGNRFRVEAALHGDASNLRPGMHGVGKIVTGRTSVLNAWVSDLVDRVRYWLWTFGY